MITHILRSVCRRCAEADDTRPSSPRKTNRADRHSRQRLKHRASAGLHLRGRPQRAGLADLVHAAGGAGERQLVGGVVEAVVEELLLDVGSHDGGLVVVAVEGRRRGVAVPAHLVDAVQTAPAPAALLANLWDGSWLEHRSPVTELSYFTDALLLKVM